LSDYQPITVDAAREIAERFGKRIVVIVGWDGGTGQTHITTYGERAADKPWAAQAGEVIAQALNVGPPKTTYEDWRMRDAAQAAYEIGELRKACKMADALVAELMPSDPHDPRLKEIQRAVRGALSITDDEAQQPKPPAGGGA
jgi:hypothetical protein